MRVSNAWNKKWVKTENRNKTKLLLQLETPLHTTDKLTVSELEFS